MKCKRGFRERLRNAYEQARYSQRTFVIALAVPSMADRSSSTRTDLII
jgi:hypothetical protein